MYVRPTTSYTSETSAAFQYDEKEVRLLYGLAAGPEVLEKGIEKLAFSIEASADAQSSISFLDLAFARPGRGRARTSAAIVRGRAMTLAWYVGKGGQRPQTHITFCIRGHEHARAVHSSNAEAMHAWDARTASRSCRHPARSID
ncbi:hypothetical protein CMV_027117 [Castanea mollissima]|uniref:Uncharacterized protein n=1 Tax=Castanea mollissima TaxID=60419 RepID=A0A8J4QAU5_9ROSI|nr:hypothetical protein CMV_027117 [Castanea mollissima]